MEYSDYIDYGVKVKTALIDDLNGYIDFRIHEKEDCISVDIKNHDYNFRYIIVNVTQKIYSGVTIEETVNNIEKDYWKDVRKVFFKSERKKERERRERDGISDIDDVDYSGLYPNVRV